MRSRGGSWIVLAVACVWAFGLSGWLAGWRTGAWTPDLGLVLFLALGPRLASGEVFAAAAVVALARTAVSIDPPAAIFAGYLAVGGVYAALRSTLDLEGVLRRAALAAAGAAAVAAWLQAVHLARVSAASALAPELGPAWRVGPPTALALLLLAPVVGRVPGLWRDGGRR